MEEDLVWKAVFLGTPADTAEYKWVTTPASTIAHSVIVSWSGIEKWNATFSTIKPRPRNDYDEGGRSEWVAHAKTFTNITNKR